MCPIFVIKFSGVSDLQGVKVPIFPLTLLVIVTTVLRYRAACDKIAPRQSRRVYLIYRVNAIFGVRFGRRKEKVDKKANLYEN